jgi:hypothetical protein
MSKLPNSCWEILCKKEDYSLPVDIARLLIDSSVSLENGKEAETDKTSGQQPLNDYTNHSVSLKGTHAPFLKTSESVSTVSKSERDVTAKSEAPHQMVYQQAFERLKFLSGIAAGVKDFVDNQIKINATENTELRKVFRSFQPAAETLRGAIRKRVARGRELKHLLFPVPDRRSAQSNPHDKPCQGITVVERTASD